jgi:hypothetical protein
MTNATQDRSAGRTLGWPSYPESSQPLLRERVSGRLRGAQAREQIARTLSLIVEDAFMVPSGRLVAHLQDALDQPVAAATEAAIDTLVDELADLLDLLPEVESPAWERSRIEAELGLE